MTDIETRVVEQTLRIAARPETVWRYWTDPQLMADWWGAAQLDPQPGGTYVVEMEGGPVMSGIVAAYRLQQAGVPYVVIDKNPDVGGTWPAPPR